MRVVKAGVAAALLAAAGFVAFRAGSGRADTPPPAAAPSLAVARVTRADLGDTRLLPGSLGYGSGTAVRGSGPGIVTSLPAVGKTVKRGRPLYRVDDQPVLVLFGDTPLFRPLDKPGLTGRDVAELRDNLAYLGYADGSVRHEDVLDAKLLDAVRRWQKDLDLPIPSVALTPARAVVLPGPGRVSAITARLGDPAAGDLFTVTGSTKVVTVPVAATDAGSIKSGAAVAVLLPSGTSAAGTVRSVGTVVTGGDNPVDSTDSPKLTVTVKLTRPADVAQLDAAAVQVRFTTTVHKNVLSVPVGALVALREGGYAVQKRDGSLVPARTGMFSAGRVEVSGPQVTEGLEVVTTP